MTGDPFVKELKWTKVDFEKSSCDEETQLEVNPRPGMGKEESPGEIVWIIEERRVSERVVVYSSLTSNSLLLRTFIRDR